MRIKQRFLGMKFIILFAHIAALSFAVLADTSFDLLNYRYLWNDDAEKARMIINPASKRKEADAWKPPRKLTEAECTKLIRIMTDRFGEPAKCRNGYASFVYVWRFEGDQWLSVGVCTMANMGGGKKGRNLLIQLY